MIIAFLFILLFSACSPQPSVGTEVKTETADSTSSNPSTDARLSKIKLPPGFKIEIYSDAVPNARAMALSPSGTLYVGTMSEGKVYAIKDKDGDGKSRTETKIHESRGGSNGCPRKERIPFWASRQSNRHSSLRSGDASGYFP